MSSFEEMSTQLHFSLDMILQCYPPPLIHQCRHHGKGAMKGFSGTLKNLVYQDVMSVFSPKEFSKYPERSVKGIFFLFFFFTEEVLKDPGDIESSPRITDTLEIPMVKIFLIIEKLAS